MAYREENGQVVLTMSVEDWQIVLMALGAFTALVWKKEDGHRMLEMLNRLNSGNPHYTPYQVGEEGNRDSR